jgi:hypothetical protein
MNSLRFHSLPRNIFCAVAIAGSLAILAGCEAAQVANRTINQSSYLPDLQYRQVIDNLAIIADSPTALPYFNPPNSSKTTIQRTAQTTFGMQWGLISALQHVKTRGTMPLVAAITKTYQPLVVSQITPGVQGTQQSIEEWDTALSLDPVRSIVMQGLYRKVLGYPLATPFQVRLLQKFFYDYPNHNVTDSSDASSEGPMPPYLAVQEAADHQNSLKARVDAAAKAYPTTSAVRAPVPPAPGAGISGPATTPGGSLAALPAEPATVAPATTHSHIPAQLKEVFKCDEAGIIARLERLSLCSASQECTRTLAVRLARTVLMTLDGPAPDPDGPFKTAVLNATVAVANLAQQVQVERPIRERGDTYANYNAEFRGLYHSLQPGWVGRGTRKDVPRDACYVGHHGQTYVWVTSDHLDQLTNLTIAILDAATANNATATLTTNPISGGPPALIPVGGTAAPKTRDGEAPAQYYMPFSLFPAARDRVNQTPPPGPNVVPAPPVSSGMFR